VHNRIFSLNSAFFSGQSCGVREIPIIRSSWLQCREGPPTGEDFSRFIRNWTNESRRLVGALWLRSKRSAIQATGRSVARLGIRADNSQLHTAGLAPREAFFRGRYALLALPETELRKPKKDQQGRLAEEWVFTRRTISSSPRERFGWDHQYREACGLSAWQPEVSRAEIFWDDWWREAASTGREGQWLAWRRTVKRVHLHTRSLNLILRPPSLVPLSKGQWVPKHELPARVCSFPGIGASIRCARVGQPIFVPEGFR
jgi:hypothetical protein